MAVDSYGHSLAPYELPFISQDVHQAQSIKDILHSLSVVNKTDVHLFMKYFNFFSHIRNSFFLVLPAENHNR
jgi:hypothetical protein